METPINDSPDRDVQDKQTSPTVSKDKWLVHARAKLTKGYILIVSTERRSANFYKSGSGYEMCAYKVATELVQRGIVKKQKDHYLGTAYVLADDQAA